MASFERLVQKAATRANLRRDSSYLTAYYNGNSIKKMSKDLILQFPILLSQNISQETAATLAAGFEVENTILLRLLLQNDFGTLTNGSGDLIASLRMLHTNIEGKPGLLENLTAECLSQSVPIEDKFCKWSLNESTLPKYLREAESGNYHFEKNDTDNHGADVNFGIGKVGFTNNTTTSRTVTASISNDTPFNPDMFKKVNELQPTFVKVKISIANSTVTDRSANVGVNLPNFLNFKGPLKGMFSKRDNDGNVTGLDMTDYGIGGNRNISRTSLEEKEVIFGVKCIAHPLKSEDIIFNIGNEFKNSTLFKFVKWTTGEYGFVKGLGELIFDFTNMKNTGIQAAKTSNYWWFKLRKLRNENKQMWHSSNSERNKPIKTATLVITKDEVDYISTTYRIDLSMPKFVQRLMNSLYLLNFAYVDEATKLVYLYDEPSADYTVKKIDDFKKKKKEQPISIDDIKSLFGR